MNSIPVRFTSRLPKSSKHRTVALLALLIATAPALARAQVTTTGIIRVAVTDQDDLPIPGATVTAGGIPAEYVGAPGLLSSVITKSGTNRLSGSVNYFFQNDGLVAENRNASDQEFSRFDTALTGGGPIVTDEAWFFGSYRRVGRSAAELRRRVSPLNRSRAETTPNLN